MMHSAGSRFNRVMARWYMAGSGYADTERSSPSLRGDVRRLTFVNLSSSLESSKSKSRPEDLVMSICNREVPLARTILECIFSQS